MAGEARERILARLTEARDVDCVLGDVPPLAFELAHALGVPSIALANFSWDWIYESLGFAAAAATARRAYEKATLLLECTPAAPMDAFPERVSLGVLGRRSRASSGDVRRELGLAPDERCVLLALRAPLLDAIALPPPSPGVRYVSPAGAQRVREDAMVLPSRLDFLDALGIADAVVARAGYGIIGDCATNGAPLLWVRRDGFPEDAVLAAWLAGRDWARELSVDALMRGSWGAKLDEVRSLGRVAAADADVAARAALEIARLLD
jgi:hypothetical protein